MLSISQFKTQYNTIKENALDQEYENISCNETMLSSFLDYFSSKFSETTKIFSKFDFPALKIFCHESLLLSLEEGEGLFKKNDPCDHYYFLLFGDINLYEEECSKSGKLLKTISAGTLYGHKIKSTFNYFAIAKNSTVYIKISKIKFDEIINYTNLRKLEFKSFFLKKFFPKLRMYSDDVLTSLKPFFIREQFEKDSKIIVDGEYDEFVYVVIKGQVAFVKSTRRIKNLQNTARRWVILETLSRGDVFGAFSALKHNKNNYTVRVLSEKAEVYKISKAHCLFYFGGSAGVIPEALKGIDSIQQVSINFKLNYLESTPNDMISPHLNFIYHDSHEQALKRTIDETEIDNSIKDAWKDLENLGSKISEFKNNLLKNNLGSKNSADIFSKMKSQDGDVESKFY
jgi:CRP-like cAMP-binding protein